MSDFGEVVWKRAGKPHQCEWCGESILKGEEHGHFTGQWEGEWQNWRMHKECYEAYLRDDDALGFGFVPHDNPRGSAEY